MTDLIAEIEKRVYHNEISLVAGRDHLSVEEKSYIRFGHDRCFIFLMPIVKKLIEDNDKTIRINCEYYGGGSDQIEMRNKELLKLLGSENE